MRWGRRSVSDRTRRRNHEVDLVAVRASRVLALGEAKLRALGPSDLDRLLRIRDPLDAPEASIVLASPVDWYRAPTEDQQELYVAARF